MTTFDLQEYTIIELDTKENISSGSNFRILWKNPNGEKGEFGAALSGTSKIVYQFAENEFPISGIWEIQAACEVAGRRLYGEIVKVNVLKTLDVE